MMCVSIAEPSLEKCIDALRSLELAEIRLDICPNDSNSIKKIFSQKTKLVATCRPTRISDEKRKQILLDAIEFGASFVDIEIETSDEYKKELIVKAKSKGCKVIISYHDFKRTPSDGELKEILNWCFESGADVAKIACMVHNDQDNARLLGLLDVGCNERRIVVVGMGEKGKITRVVAPLLGSPFTFASLAKGKETADGQMDKNSLERIMKMLEKEIGGKVK